MPPSNVKPAHKPLAAAYADVSMAVLQLGILIDRFENRRHAAEMSRAILDAQTRAAVSGDLKSSLGGAGASRLPRHPIVWLTDLTSLIDSFTKST
jgi:hypothetical protein